MQNIGWFETSGKGVIHSYIVPTQPILAAFVNAVMDALSPLGVRNIDMPVFSGRVWEAITQQHDVAGYPPLPGH